jgi:hypothetical protein
VVANAEEEGGEGDDEEDDGPIEAEDDIDPAQSTGNYSYVKSTVLFKEQAAKFRQGCK